ncbi:hypothetical protein HOF56_01015, partial [Candidatus Peribacteria bacterium]|nr:hypothetical protein [Candidatus Peribacteria bacterium]
MPPRKSKNKKPQKNPKFDLFMSVTSIALVIFISIALAINIADPDMSGLSAQVAGSPEFNDDIDYTIEEEDIDDSPEEGMDDSPGNICGDGECNDGECSDGCSDCSSEDCCDNGTIDPNEECDTPVDRNSAECDATQNMQSPSMPPGGWRCTNECMCQICSDYDNDGCCIAFDNAMYNTCIGSDECDPNPNALNSETQCGSDACTNGEDDDGNGDVDCDDAACSTHNTCISEDQHLGNPCEDGIDNDGDLYIDCFDDDCSGENICMGYCCVVTEGGEDCPNHNIGGCSIGDNNFFGDLNDCLNTCSNAQNLNCDWASDVSSPSPGDSCSSIDSAMNNIQIACDEGCGSIACDVEYSGNEWSCTDGDSTGTRAEGVYVCSLCDNGETNFTCGSQFPPEGCITAANTEDCSNGEDEDGDGDTDCSDTIDCPNGTSCGDYGMECSEGACVCPTGNNEVLSQCRDGIDNDCDGSKDCADLSCGGHSCDAEGRICFNGQCWCPGGGAACGDAEPVPNVNNNEEDDEEEIMNPCGIGMPCSTGYTCNETLFICEPTEDTEDESDEEGGENEPLANVSVLPPHSSFSFVSSPDSNSESEYESFESSTGTPWEDLSLEDPHAQAALT